MRPNKLITAAILSLSATVFNAGHARAEDVDVVTTIRVLHYNIFGRDKSDCGARFRALADHIRRADPPYDIVSLNEQWQTDPDPWYHCPAAPALTDDLMKDGFFTKSNIRTSYPKGDTFQASGGMSIFTSHRIEEFESFTFENSNDVPVSGFMYSRIGLGKGLTLDFWTTHLEASSDDCSDNCRHTQIKHLADYVMSYSGWYSGKGWEGNPVLIAGDFNIGGPLTLLERTNKLAGISTKPYKGNGGYEDMMSYFKNPRDLWLESHPVGKESDGYTYDCHANTINKNSKCDADRIDYIFVPEHRRFKRSFYDIRNKGTHVVRWKTPDGKDISDHYGLESTVEITRKRIELPTSTSVPRGNDPESYHMYGIPVRIK